MEQQRLTRLKLTLLKNGQIKMRNLKTNKKGVTLIELTLSLVLFAIFLAMIARTISYLTEIQNARSIAIRQVEIINASRAYINANQSSLVSQTASGNVIPIVVGRESINDPIPADSLQANGFLPSGFVNTNLYRQKSVLLVRQGATSGTLDAVLATYDGQAASDSVLGLAAYYIGPMGGMIQKDPPSGDTTLIYGYKGGWQANISDYENDTYALTPGHTVAYVESATAQITGDFLWRTDTGVPEANRMHTNIDMNNNGLDNVSTVTAAEEALHVLAKIDAEAIVPPKGSTETVATAASNYTDDSGNRYDYYMRPDGYNRLRYLDPTTRIDKSDDAAATLGKNYPAYTRLIDALPDIVIKASYLVEDNTIVPKPVCGNPSNPAAATYARIYAMPTSSFNYVGPAAKTDTAVNYTQLSVLTNASLSYNNFTYTLSTARADVRSTNSVSATTNVDTTAFASGMYAVDNSNSWIFRYPSKNWVLASTRPGADTSVKDAATNNTYKNTAMVQTACYYGTN
jgi:prepilin-type N-terminal cleavage/methylation domain-containing protein